MCRRARALLIGIAVAVFSASTSATLSAQPNGSIYTQCPGDTDGDGVPDVAVPGHPNVHCMHLAAGDGFITMADGKPIYTFGFSDVTGEAPVGNRQRRPGRSELPGADDSPEGGSGVLPLAHERRDDPAARSVRPALRALPRLPAGRVDLRRRARVLRDDQHGLDLHLLLQHRRRPGRHLHVPLPRRGDRAHADGHARQLYVDPQTERDRIRRSRDAGQTRGWARRRAAGLRLQRRRRLARPTTSSTRSRSARSTRTSTTSTSRSSRCRSRPWTTTTRC